MPKLTHEAIVQLVRNAPALVGYLLDREHRLPSSSIHISQNEFIDLNHAEYRADDVLLYGQDPRAPVRVRVVEIQLSIDPDKPDRWQLHVSGLRVRYRCPVDLVVIALDPDVAAWAARTIKAGLSEGAQRLTPDVIGPAQIPVITDPDEARRDPELAVLSLIAHGDEPGAERIAIAAIEGAQDLDTDRAAVYLDVVFARLGEAARAALEKLMQTGSYEFQSDIARNWFSKGKAEGKAEGEAKGEAKVLLQLMELRDLEIPDSIREQILGATDCAQIEVWVSRVLYAKTAAEVVES
jgi:hypothetical protein